MTEANPSPEPCPETTPATCDAPPAPAAATREEPPRVRSMHEGIPVWCDCCSCEAEPDWVEIAAEMGIDIRP